MELTDITSRQSDGPEGPDPGDSKSWVVLVRLLDQHASLVTAIAQKYAGRGLPMPELVRVGQAGLDQAAREHDPSRGVPFSTLASWWIKHAIRLALARRGRSGLTGRAVPGRYTGARPSREVRRLPDRRDTPALRSDR